MENPKEMLRKLIDVNHDGGYLPDSEYEAMLTLVEQSPEIADVFVAPDLTVHDLNVSTVRTMTPQNELDAGFPSLTPRPGAWASRLRPRAS